MNTEPTRRRRSGRITSGGYSRASASADQDTLADDSLTIQPRPPQASREPGPSPSPLLQRVIRTKEDMSDAERRYLVDDMLHARIRCGDRAFRSGSEVTAEDRDRAITAALEGWNTSLPEKSMQKMPRITSLATQAGRVSYGTLRSDNPQQSSSRKRRRGPEVYLYYNPLNRNDACAFSFRDSNGGRVREVHVQPAVGVDLNNAKLEAIKDYNERELLQVQKFNRALMIFKAQRRMVQFASRGEENKANPFFEPKSEKSYLDFCIAFLFMV